MNGPPQNSWIVKYAFADGDHSCFFVSQKGPEKKIASWFGKRYPDRRLLSVEPDWVSRVSREIMEENGEAESRLRAKCRWEQRSRTAIIMEYGDPRQWN